MQLGYTILYVPDVPATLKFYEAAFGLTTRFLHESGDYGELDTGSTTLAFSAHRLMQQLGKNPQAANAHAPCFEIALCTPDVPAALALVALHPQPRVPDAAAFLDPDLRRDALFHGLHMADHTNHLAAGVE